MDRVLSTSMVYPGNYGFINKTISRDNDPVKVLIINETPFYPGSIVICKLIGVLETEDEKGEDHKMLALPIDQIENRFININDLKDLP